MRIGQFLLQRIALMMGVLGFLLTGAYGVQAWEWIPFEEGVTEGTEPEAIVVQSDEHGTIIDFTVYGMYRRQKEEDGEMFDVLEFRGDSHTVPSKVRITGYPEVPTLLWNVAMPPQSKVSVEAEESSLVTLKLTGYRVYPNQPPWVGNNPKPPFTYDEAVYSSNRFFPEEVVQLGSISVVSRVREVLVRLQLVHFNPVTGELMVYRSGRVIVEYYGISDDNIIENPLAPKPSAEDFLGRYLINYDFLSSLGYPMSVVCSGTWGSIKSLR